MGLCFGEGDQTIDKMFSSHYHFQQQRNFSNLWSSLCPCMAAQDHACKIKRNMAMRAINDLSGKRKAEAMEDEEKRRNVTNAERDLHKHFRRLGLSLAIPIRQLKPTLSDGGTGVTEYINPSDWLKLLVRKYSFLLAGGTSPIESTLLGFWELHRFHHPCHPVFAIHNQHLGKVFPLCFWGDEGRGPRRSHYLEGTIECPLGLWDKDVTCDCHDCLQSLPAHWLPAEPSQIRDTPHLDSVDRIETNYRGHSYLKRHFLFGLPGFVYETEPGIIKKHLEVIADDLVNLFNTGFRKDDDVFYAALIGSKGDLKFQAQTIASMTRSYANMGTINQIRMCSLCRAGDPDCPMEDVNVEPGWQHTMYFDRPWEQGNAPPFTRVPHDHLHPERLYKRDFFHCFKVGLARDIIGSTVIWLCHLGCFDLQDGTQNLDDRLERAHTQFKLWALTEGYSPALRSFTKHFMNSRVYADSAWANSKGSDSMILLRWLRFYLGLILSSPCDAVQPHALHLQLVRDVIHNGISMCDLVYSHNLFLRRHCARRLYLHIMVVVRGYKKIAAYCLEKHLPGYRLKPKLHALAHMALEIRKGLKTKTPRLLNVLIWACEMNEDHIGHVARLSRKLATRTLGQRLAQRYLLKSKALFRRHLEKRKKVN